MTPFAFPYLIIINYFMIEIQATKCFVILSSLG